MSAQSFAPLLLPPALLFVPSPPVTVLAIAAAITDRQTPVALLKRFLADALELGTERALTKPQLRLDLRRNHAVRVVQIAVGQVEMAGQKPDQPTIT